MLSLIITQKSKMVLGLENVPESYTAYDLIQDLRKVGGGKVRFVEGPITEDFLKIREVTHA
jgi:hypothetical protein